MNFKVAQTLVIIRDSGNNKSHREKQTVNLIIPKASLLKKELKMANITISDLRPAGSDLFSDSESYLTDLTESEMLGTLVGGYQRAIIIGRTNFCVYW
jgi:hypothetical protein